MYLSHDLLAFDFPYDASQVAEMKAIPGAKWDKIEKLWKVPATSIEQARAFALKHNFEITNEVLTFDTPKRSLKKGVYRKGDWVYIQFPYDKVVLTAIKKIPGVTWDNREMAWRAPLTSARETIAWAEHFDVVVEGEVHSLAGSITKKLEELQQASRSTDAEIEIPELQGTMFPYQKAGIAYASNAKRCFIADDMGLGKLQAVSSLVHTPSGWVRMGDIVPGMHVTGRNGKPTLVTAVYPQGVKELYRVTFSDGSSTLAGEEHLWSVSSANKYDWHTVTTGQIMRGETLIHKNEKNGRTYKLSLSLKAKNGNRRLQIPLVEPVHYLKEDDPLPLDPYLLGCWLGDGSSSSGQITSMDTEIHSAFEFYFKKGATRHKDGIRSTQVTSLGMMTVLRDMGVLHNKHIPEQYMRANPEARLALIQGLMDTDGYAGDCSTEFSASNRLLVDGIVDLVQSLGGVARVRERIPTFTYLGEKRKGKKSYRVNIKLPDYLIPFRLQRKIDSYVAPSKYPPARYIESIEYSHDEDAQCIAVDAEDHLYVTDSYIVTHNTIQAIGTLEYSSKSADVYPAVIVCPPTLVLNWKAEWNRWLPHRRVEVVTNRKDFPIKGEYDVLVVGYSNISHWEKQLLGHKSYIYDESHYVKSPSAQRTKAAIKMAKTASKDGVVLCLTGTPVTNRPAEYASQLDVIGKLKEFGGLWGFYRRYCNAFQDSFGQWNISGHSHLDELNDRLRGTCYIRRTKSQVMSELPPVFHAPVLIEGTPAGMKEYEKAEKDIIKYITDRAREIALELGESPHSAAVIAKIKAESNEHLVKLSVLRRLAAKAKMPAVEEWVKERIENGNKVVIAAHHRDIVDELARKFGNLRIQGGMDVAEIEAQKKRFQEAPVEEAPVIVLSIQAAKTGHTLTAAQDILFVELPWTPADLDQTYSRLHRIGQKGSVTATYMMTNGTIDQEIYNLIEKKRSVVNAAVDGGEFAESFGAEQLILDLLKR
jgi:hypothetical protein